MYSNNIDCEPNGSFYRSLDRDPDCCMYCKHPLKTRESVLCTRCNQSDFKNVPDYQNQLGKHYDDCMCHICYENKQKVPLKKENILKFLAENRFPLPAWKYYICVLDSKDFYEIKHFFDEKCPGWNGERKTCKCGYFNVNWVWDRYHGILSPKTSMR